MNSNNMAAPGNEVTAKNTITTLKVEEDDKEIDLLDMGMALVEKLPYIILCFLLGAVIFNAYAYFMVKPTYQSTAKLYVVSASSDSVVNLQDLNLGSSLTKDYEDLILSYPVLDQVIDKMGLNMNSADLAKMISLENPTDTRVLKITVTSTDKQQACDIANTLADISVDYLPDTMSTNAPNIAQVARVADQKVGPSYLKYTAIGAILGALIYCIIIIIGYLMDDTIHSADDLEKYFGIVPLTVIPESDQFRTDDGQDYEPRKLGKRGAKHE